MELIFVQLTVNDPFQGCDCLADCLAQLAQITCRLAKLHPRTGRKNNKT